MSPVRAGPRGCIARVCLAFACRLCDRTAQSAFIAIDCPGTLHSQVGGWPLPAAGGQRRHCSDVRPYLPSAVDSESEAKRARGTCPITLRFDLRRARSGTTPSIAAPEPGITETPRLATVPSQPT